MNALIFSGALDGFKLNRKTLFEKRNVQVDAYELFVSDIVSKTFDEYDLGTLIEKRKKKFSALTYKCHHLCSMRHTSRTIT